MIVSKIFLFQMYQFVLKVNTKLFQWILYIFEATLRIIMLNLKIFYLIKYIIKYIIYTFCSIILTIKWTIDACPKKKWLFKMFLFEMYQFV